MTSAAVDRPTRCNALPWRPFFQPVLSALLIAALPCSAVAQEYRYAIINVGDPGGVGIAEARACSNAGHVIGISFNGSVGELQAFAWKDGVSSYLPSLFSNFETYASDVNDVGAIVGRAHNAQREHRAVLWPATGGVTNLGTLGGSYSRAYGINQSGDVVGVSELSEPGATLPFLWRNGDMTGLGGFEGPDGSAEAINDAGQIVGEAYWDGFAGFSAFLWNNGLPMNLGGLLSNRRSFARDIGESDLIVGHAEVLDSTARAVIWRNGQIFNIHNDNIGVESAAYGVNTADQVVGLIVVDDFPLKFGAFLYEGEGPMADLETMLPPRPSWAGLEAAFDINDHGEIVGRGDRGSSRTAAFLLSPVHPTLTLQGPQPGRAGAVNGLRLTGCTPGERVHFYYSTTGGGTLVPGCSHTDGVTLQLENPIRIGSATANANGVATLTRFVPPQARNLGDILIQAVQPESCRISQLVVHEFE